MEKESIKSSRKRLIIIAFMIAALSMTAALVVKRSAFKRDAVQNETVKQKTDEIDYWTCSMHPFVKQTQAGKCPICAMDLIPVNKGDVALEDKTSFVISPQRRQLIGVKLIEVEPKTMEKSIRAVGTIALDETKITDVYTKFSGWVDKVYVNQTWQHVKKGDPLFTIYSPELLATQEEYLLALRAKETFQESPYRKLSGADSLTEAARRRLALWDISNEQIETLEKTGKAQRALTIYAPASGHVILKNAYPNTQVSPETKIYVIADHSTVWANIDVYESDIAMVKLGQRAEMTLPAYPGRIFRGKVVFIAPHLDAQTRTLRVRLEFANPDLLLKPEMYAEAELKSSMGERLMVPESAVIRSGKTNIVFVSADEGHFEVRNIELGMKTGDEYEVLSGLEAGDTIAVSANFLIDAESKLQGVKSAWEK